MKVNVTYKPGDVEPFGRGFEVVGRFKARIERDDLPYAVTLKATLEGGRFLVESLCAERLPKGEPVTSEGIRGLPVATLLRTVAATSLLLRVKRTPSGGNRVAPMKLPDLRALAADGATDEVLRHVALIYRLGYAVGYGPTLEVVEAFGISRATAGRWIAQARERGYLGKAEERRAGESKRKGKGS